MTDSFENTPKIICNSIRTPDGTVMFSRDRHDYQTHKDANGHTYMVDGGLDYLRRNSVPDAPYEELSVYSTDPYELIRDNFYRGGRGPKMDQPLTWTVLSKMSNRWIEACIVYNRDRGLDNSMASDLYRKELVYREERGIFIAE